mmetsp:Transcript_17360/g.32911  ORF Transcript_17360/g.32911 Transcript_17360/m.32911 type:complete len:355 (+) Transcript_17360:184-1248(+)
MTSFFFSPYRTRRKLRGIGGSTSSHTTKSNSYYLLHFLLLLLLGILTLLSYYFYASFLVQSTTSSENFTLIHKPNNNHHDESIQQEQQRQQPKTTEQQQEQRGHHCLNPDFQPEHKVGIWTMLNDNMSYTLGAAKMGRGVNRHTQTPHDLIVMEIESKPLGPEHWAKLSQIGFKRCVVQSIPPPQQTRPDLKEKFAVLHVWAMTVYDTVLFIDADTFVQNSLDDLINMDLNGKTIGVTKDIRARKWVDTFNSGVLLLHPDEKEYQRLIGLLKSGLVFDYIMSDQGFLNEVYKNDWHEIGFMNNANLALYRFQREFWDQHKVSDINIIHYTMQKPWKCKPNGPYGPICKIWIDAE